MRLATLANSWPLRTAAVAAICMSACAFAADALPATVPLDWPEEDLSSRMMDGGHRFVERQIAQARENRSRYWKYDVSSPDAWKKTLLENRECLCEIIGAVDQRVAPR